MLVVVVAVVVVAAAVLVGLWAAGVGPFAPASSSTSSGPSYDVTFSETGLPASTTWSVTLGGSTQSSTGAIVFSERNGTYSYTVGSVSGYAPSPASGSVTVSGAASSQPITWSPQAPGTYSVAFQESGLPTGTSWSVTLASSTNSGTGTSIVFNEKNGTYPFTAGTVGGYTASPPSGTIIVSGPGASQTITYKSSGGSGAGETYSAAAAAAESPAAGVAGGPWKLAGGTGVVLPSAVAVNSTLLNESAAGAGCTGHLLSGASGITSFPSTSSAPSSGLSNTWDVWFVNASLGILEVAVLNGVATPFLTAMPYGGCDSTVTAVVLPSDYVDSPEAASVAYADGGSAWISAWPQYVLEEILVPSTTITIGTTSSTLWSTWEVTYTNCNPNEEGSTLGGGSPAQFTASINATTGAFIRGINTTTSCPVLKGGGAGGAKPTLASSCYFFSYEDNETPTYYNNATLACVSISLKADDLTASLVNNTTHAAVATTGFTLEIVNDTTLAVESTYSFSTGKWSTNVSVGGLSSENEFVLITPRSMAGDNLVLTATSFAPATGSITTYLGQE